MILSWCCYAIILLLIIWGGKFSGFGNKFNEDFATLDVTRSLRGLSALCIIFHHISLQKSFQMTGELSIFSGTGIFFVSVFFFYSGYGLIKSIDTKPGYLNEFLKTRVLKSLVVPFYLNVILCAIFFLVAGCTLPVTNWITGLLGLTLLNEYAWYPVVLVIFYLLFYVLFYNLRRREDAFYFMFLAITVLAVFFCLFGHYPFVEKVYGWNERVVSQEDVTWWLTSKNYWFCGEWWINTNITFLLGMIFANREKEIVSWFKSFYWVKLLISALLFAGLIVLRNNVLAVNNYWNELMTGQNMMTDRFICFFVEQPCVILFMILVLQIMMKYESRNPVTQFFGKYSLEVYLMSYITIKGFSFLIYNEKGAAVLGTSKMNLIIFTLCVLGSTVIAGIIFKFICNQVRKLIK